MSEFLNKLKSKRVYFIRHGETKLNALKIRQGSEGGLSEQGRKQVDFLAERLKSFKINIIIASPFERTRETAEILAAAINKKIIYSDLLMERRNPSEIIGKSYDDIEVKHIVDLIDKSFHRADLRYSDEENFDDLKKRAKDLLDYLEQRPERNLLVVTHGIFLTMVVAYMQYREELTPEKYAALSYFNPMNNAGITFCHYNAFTQMNDTHGWRLLAWNDYGRIIDTPYS